MKIGTENIKLARSFNALEYIWFVFLILSFANSNTPAGGLIGTIAAIASARAFRSNKSAMAKLGIISVIIVSAFAATMIVAIFVKLMTR